MEEKQLEDLRLPLFASIIECNGQIVDSRDNGTTLQKCLHTQFKKVDISQALVVSTSYIRRVVELDPRKAYSKMRSEYLLFVNLCFVFAYITFSLRNCIICTLNLCF